MFQDRSRFGAGLFAESPLGSKEGEKEPASGVQSASAEWITAYCDGGSRGNPGPAGYGVFIQGPGGEPLAELSEYIGKATNNVAEYSGLLAAVEFALKNGHRRLRVVADSELMVKQMKGQYKVNSPDLRPLYEEAKRRVGQLEMFRIEHVLRGKNKEADRLANLAMDQGTGRPAAGRPGSRQPGSPQPGSQRPGSARPAGVGSAAGSPQAPAHREPQRVLKGYVKGGVVHLIEGELPDGVFVKVMLDRQ
jgi:ribonuclease HI